MGHYRNEMGFGAEDLKRANARKRDMEHLVKCIQEDIDEKGVARVLAEFLDANSGAIHSINYPMRGRYPE